MGQGARLPTSPEANPAVVPDGCLAPCTSLGLAQSCWDPHGLGVTSPAPCVGCRLPQVRVLGLPLTCAFTGGVGRDGNYIWKAFDGHVPDPVPIKHCPVPEALSVQDKMLAL